MPRQPQEPRERSAPSYRERHRAARHRAFLDTARRIVTTEGQAALTMQRVTDELGSSVGSIYRYFPTKDALVAELQSEAFQTLHASYLLGQARLDAVLEARDASSEVAALARLVANGRFWIDADASLPTEIELSRRLIVNDPRVVTESAEAAKVLPGAFRLLEEGQRRFDDAVAHGMLDEDDNLERSIVTVASVSGVLLASRVGAWDEELFDGPRLSTRFVVSLLRGWGADLERLEPADALVDTFVDQGELAPRPTVDDQELAG